MADNALERLINSNNIEPSNYTVEEQMASAEQNEAEESADFFGEMSDAAKQAFFGGGATEITLDEPTPIEKAPNPPIETPSMGGGLQQMMNSIEQSVVQEEPIVQTPVIEPTSVVEQPTPKKRAGRPPKHKEESNLENNTNPTVATNNVNNDITNAMFIPLMNQLAKDLIDNLLQNKYKFARFDDKQMQILYNYMYTKF